MIIKIDVCNAFNSSDRAFSLDRINGRASRDYACGLKRGDVIGTVDTLTNLFGYFKAMRTCHSKLRYFDWDGKVHLTWSFKNPKNSLSVFLLLVRSSSTLL